MALIDMPVNAGTSPPAQRAFRPAPV